MKLRQIVKNKRTLKKIIIAITAIVAMIAGTVVGNKTCTPLTTINQVQQIQDNIVIKNNSVRRASQLNKNINLNGATKMRMTCTAYEGDPITATGVRPIPYYTLAADPRILPYGTKVYIPKFNAIFEVQDTGSAIRGNRLDIFMNSYKECMDFGIRDLEIYVLQE